MVKLTKFNPDKDIKRLIKWVDSFRLNIIWASDKFNYPLTESALNGYFINLTPDKTLAFKLVETIGSEIEIIGHAEIDINGNETILSRLLIPKEKRGKGYGKKMLQKLIRFVNENMENAEIYLTVFTFNKNAIALYEKIGFKRIDIQKNYMTFEGEEWDRQKMKLFNK